MKVTREIVFPASPDEVLFTTGNCAPVPSGRGLLVWPPNPSGTVAGVGIPPFARISRSVFPARVSIEERNEPVAESPASSIATTTATPRATAKMVRAVRIGSWRSGRRIRVRKSFIAARWTAAR